MTRTNGTADGEEDEQRGVVEVGGCARCDGYTTGGDKFCSPECREQGEIDDIPL